uniref:Uncharacterized protein n=1 Tax=Chromera velia CCMP2878 TaxID=1169474 RepID=A0A0G4GDH3_9ALVE|eukprot:Cvel_21404.t1-p1 / transcript=Cvel_21404.t1 / gene=Cvel_21404 / organism=Chromera_velia_CCMP2878 / gene_product=hypothetical protein / transcript_product=hypothetical protein / location=Cvel_scaffold2005:2761-3228(-) / protein_length=67 / sequence_SO=supercontig / SO=protein_coding / is_pseudo=false
MNVCMHVGQIPGIPTTRDGTILTADVPVPPEGPAHQVKSIHCGDDFLLVEMEELTADCSKKKPEGEG